MLSEPLKRFRKRLGDVDELIHARDTICPSGAGRPAERQGAAVLKGAVVLLSAVIEAYIEDLYNKAVDCVRTDLSEDERKDLKDRTSGKLNNPSCAKVNDLFANIKICSIMENEKLHWQKCTNTSVRDTLDEIVHRRNQIAHGGGPTVTKREIAKWRSFAELMAEHLDEIVTDHISSTIGE